MTSKPLFTIITLWTIVFSSCAIDKSIRQYGVYQAKSGLCITLKEDQTFVYYRKIHIDAVNAFGYYTINSDTLILTYTNRNYDSTILSSPDFAQITFGEALGLKKEFLWKGNRLYINAGENKRVKYAKFVSR